MLTSMTGFGQSAAENEHLKVRVELRTVNHRHLKVHVRGLDGCASLETEVESLVRERLRRGAVDATFRIERQAQAQDFALNFTALQSYWTQLKAAQRQIGDESMISLAALVSLPGVVGDAGASDEEGAELSVVARAALDGAFSDLERMRRQEGGRMADELSLLCDVIDEHLQSVTVRAPLVVEEYARRFRERVNGLLAEQGLTLEQDALIRELSIFAERCDIREEIVRLQSHLVQFREILHDKAGEGRKLEFVSQEMVREANTIGSKANDVQISRHVVEIKGAIERIRELVQNVE